MSQFTKHVKGTFEFDGDTVNVVLRRLKRKDAMKLLPYMGEPDAEGKFVMAFNDQMEMMNVATDLLKDSDYIFEMSGLTIEGREVVKTGNNIANPEDWDDLFENAYFMPLLSDIMSHLMDESFIKEGDAKKSEDLQDGTSQDQTATQDSTSSDTL